MIIYTMPRGDLLRGKIQAKPGVEKPV